MRKSHLARSGLAVLLAVSLAGLAAACASPFSGLVGNAAEGTSAGLGTTPGRPADYTGYLENHTGHVVILKSARLLPLKGFHAPRLVHEAVYTGRRVATSAFDWPPTGLRLSLKSFAGYRIRPGGRIMILYSVIAHRLGEYADAGLTVTVLVNGSQAVVDVISFAGTCVIRSLKHDCPDSFYNRVQDAPVPRT
jgi:hypothetical protein